MKDDLIKKLTSRKFWLCVAAFLGSVATSISGIVTDNKYVVTIGVVAGILSAGLYAFCEAWIDGKAVQEKTLDALIGLLKDTENGNTESD